MRTNCGLVKSFPTLTKFTRTVKTLILAEASEIPIEKPSSSCYPLNVSDKVKSLDELKAITGAARRNAKIIVLTNGCFDLVHRGHISLLRAAKALGDLLVVAINSDSSVRAIKGPNRPILAEIDRLELIASMEMVDYVVMFDEPDPCQVISVLQPDILVKGGDWSPEEVVGRDLVQGNGGKVVVVPYLKGSSTTEIIAKIRS